MILPNPVHNPWNLYESMRIQRGDMIHSMAIYSGDPFLVVGAVTAPEPVSFPYDTPLGALIRVFHGLEQ